MVASLRSCSELEMNITLDLSVLNSFHKLVIAVSFSDEFSNMQAMIKIREPRIVCDKLVDLLNPVRHGSRGNGLSGGKCLPDWSLCC